MSVSVSANRAAAAPSPPYTYKFLQTGKKRVGSTHEICITIVFIFPTEKSGIINIIYIYIFSSCSDIARFVFKLLNIAEQRFGCLHRCVYITYKCTCRKLQYPFEKAKRFMSK